MQLFHCQRRLRRARWLAELRQEAERIHERRINLVRRLDPLLADVLDRSLDVEKEAPVDRLVKMQHGGMQLRHDDVFVVSLVADQRALGTVRIVRIVEPRQIAGFRRLIQLEERPPEPDFLPSYIYG